MGYRSEGKLYMSPNVQALLTDELKDDLENDWSYYGDNVWEFAYWKWYSSYSDVKAWHNFLNSLEAQGISKDDWDFIVVGEDGLVNDEVPRTYTKFEALTTIAIID